MHIAKISLRVFVDNPAVGFYERLGFCKVGEDECSLLMEKKIYDNLKIDYTEARKEDEDGVKNISNFLGGDNSDFVIGGFVIAKAGNKVVGCVRIKNIGNDCLELASLGVLYEYRMLGVGEHLVQKILAREKRRPIYLLTSAEKESFYGRFGAKLIGPTGLPLSFRGEYARITRLPFAKNIRVITMVIE